MSNVKIVYSLRIHLELQKQGFSPLVEMQNPHAPKFNCWVYDASEQFLKAFDQILDRMEDKNGIN